jgi:hypothetical protein
MEALTSYAGRRTRLMGTLGDLVGDERMLDVFLYSTRRRITWDVSKAARDLEGHGGGDRRMVRDFTQAVSRRDGSILSTNLAGALESHLIGFQAERSRLAGGQPLSVELSAELPT